jgi:hypothetical protein
MQQALSSNAQNPLDANVESVLPGVHHRFEVLTSMTNGLESKLTNLDATVTNMSVSLETAVTSLHQIVESLERRDEQLASHFLQMAGRLAPPTGSPPSPSPSPSLPPPRREPTTVAIATRTAEHHLKVKHQAMHTIYYEWHGLEDCEGFPVEGGIAALEASQKTKWRRHFSQSEKKHFSRLRIIMDGLEAASMRSSCDPFDLLDDWNVTFQEDAKKLVAKMADWVKDNGFVTKKAPRGKTARRAVSFPVVAL